VEIVDSAESTAKVVADRLSAPSNAMALAGNINGKQASDKPARSHDITYFATDSVERFRRLGQIFMGEAIDKVHLVSIGG
jgi:hypothetical protein